MRLGRYQAGCGGGDNFKHQSSPTKPYGTRSESREDSLRDLLRYIDLRTRELVTSPALAQEVADEVVSKFGEAIAGGKGPRWPTAWLEKVILTTAQELARLQRPVEISTLERRLLEGAGPLPPFELGQLPSTLRTEHPFYSWRQQFTLYWPKIRGSLTPLQASAVKLRLRGASITQISKKCGIERRRVSRVIRCAARNIRKNLGAPPL